MEFKFNFGSIIVFLCLTFICSASSSKYEHISDCSFYDRSRTPGLDNVTFICSGHDNENGVFVNSENIKCSNIQTQPNRWPGTIDFRDCQFPTIKRNYFEIFYNMHTFILSNVELETMQMEIFREAKNVSVLDISQNKLTEIPSLIFFNAIKLKNLDFSNNTIKVIAPMAFEGAINLQTLNLSYNQINEVDTLNLPNLQTLDLSNNNLTELLDHAFDKLVNLKQLNLSCNAIGNLDKKTLSYLIHLEDLNLKQTDLSNIELGTFSNQHKLVSLDLSGNNLKKLDFKLFFPIQHEMRLLHLGRNQLKDLSGFRNTLFPQLNSLDIQGNQFNCSYLEHFMESVDWEKIHLHLDLNSIIVQHDSKIHGISCDDSEDTQEAEFFKFDDNESTQTTQTYRILNDDPIIKVALVFICVILTVFIILFTIANLDRINSQFSKPLIFYKRNRDHSSKENVVEFSNDGDGVVIT